jgi:tRNA (mo5U34)-methyltransferase
MPDAGPTLAEQVAGIRWFHTLHLPDGIVTPGAIDSARLLARLDLPASLAGKTVLDVGAWDGYHSFECARRGAEVLATDSYSWGDGGWGTQEGFLLARKALGLEDRVADQHIDVMDLAPEKIGGRRDVVLLLGVLYHLKDPITALERVASCCNELLILETETALPWLPYPAARIYPGSGLANDHTNWYQLNPRALKGLLARVGFGDVDIKYRTPTWRRAARSLVGERHGQTRRMMFRASRIVLHARRHERID